MDTRVAVPGHFDSPLGGVFANDVAIDELERGMLRSIANGGPAVDVPTVHRFAPGIYAREVTIPAGTLLTGKIHRTRHLNVLSAGVIAVYTATEGWRELRAPFSFVAEPGTRRVGYVLEDAVWTTIHGTQETDLERLEAELIEPHDSAREVLCPG